MMKTDFSTHRTVALAGLLMLSTALAAVRAGQVDRASTATAPTQPAGREIWFDDLRSPCGVSDEEGRALARYLAGQLIGGGAGVGFPESLRAGTQPRLLLLSVSDGRHPAAIVLGGGRGMSEATARALRRARRLVKRPVWIKLDVVGSVEPLPAGALERPLQLDRSLYGLAFDRSRPVALLPEELTLHGLVDSRQRLRPDRLGAYLTRTRRLRGAAWTGGGWPLGKMRAYRFAASSFFTDGREVIVLYRGHRRFRRLGPQLLLASAKMAGDYLRRSVGPEGKFTYLYHSAAGEVPERYNLVRHAGGVYAMLELYELTRERALLAAAVRAMGYLCKSARPGLSDPKRTACIVEDDWAKLGGNALAVIALLKYQQVTGDRGKLPLARRLGRWIQRCQDKTGRFAVQKQAYTTGLVSDFVSVYYPGEAMLAMVRLGKADPAGPWLDVAERAAKYFIEVRDRRRPLPDHWQLHALNELYQLRRKDAYRRQAMRMARAIVEAQDREGLYPDWRGSFYRPPRSAPTATRMEGLCAAYQLAIAAGWPEQARSLLPALRMGVAFILQTQVRPETAMYLARPQRALGGVRRGLTSDSIRIDYVQHFISATLGLYRILRSAPTAPAGLVPSGASTGGGYRVVPGHGDKSHLGRGAADRGDRPD